MHRMHRPAWTRPARCRRRNRRRRWARAIRCGKGGGGRETENLRVATILPTRSLIGRLRPDAAQFSRRDPKFREFARDRRRSDLRKIIRAALSTSRPAPRLQGKPAPSSCPSRCPCRSLSLRGLVAFAGPGMASLRPMAPWRWWPGRGNVGVGCRSAVLRRRVADAGMPRCGAHVQASRESIRPSSNPHAIDAHCRRCVPAIPRIGSTVGETTATLAFAPECAGRPCATAGRSPAGRGPAGLRETLTTTALTLQTFVEARSETRHPAAGGHMDSDQAGVSAVVKVLEESRASPARPTFSP